MSIHPDDHGAVNPTIPFWGGRDALGDSTAAAEQVYSYGSSSQRLGIAPLAGFNGLSDAALALDYATTHGGVSAQLANGTEPFAGGLLLP